MIVVLLLLLLLLLLVVGFATSVRILKQYERGVAVTAAAHLNGAPV
jgi:regulator of protease activity HflC (stomatin/prohibitin superfamily)